MTDVHDRHFVLGIATTGVRLTNDLSGLETSSSPFLNLDTRTVYAYQLVAHDDMVELFIDGEKKLELGVDSPRSVPNRTNTVRFGDASLLASSATTVGYVNVFAVPEPGSWLLFAGGLVLGLGYWHGAATGSDRRLRSWRELNELPNSTAPHEWRGRLCM